ncbi:MAG TPA: Bax inhibitor-1/YccA family protein [Chloroflexaceae bacterium]|nr:Bax inhibitor-1/YccA family protein [Chloroflexaceae bacterium]
MTMSSVSSVAHVEAVAEQRGMAGVYAWMMLGLGLTGAVAWFAASTPAVLAFIQGRIWVLFALVAVQFVVALILGTMVMRLPPALATVLFLVYSALTGLTLSLLVVLFPIGAIMLAIAATAVVFGLLSAYGFLTRRDLSGLALFFFFALLGLALVSTVNYFFLSSGWLDWLLSIGSVLVFAGMTAYQTQQIKRRLAEARDAHGAGQATLYGAFTLYLNFINMFLRFLALTGKQQNTAQRAGTSVHK